MSSSPLHLIGRLGSRRDAVESIQRFLARSHRPCSFEVWGVARIGKTQVITAAIEEVKQKSKRKIHILPDDLSQPLSLRRLYEVVSRWSDQSRPEPRGGGTTRFSDSKTASDLLSEIDRILDERTRPGDMVLLRILISAIDSSAEELSYVFRTWNERTSSRKIIVEMRHRLQMLFLHDHTLHGGTASIVGLQDDEPETMVRSKLAGCFDEERLSPIAYAARRWCGRHPGLLATFLKRIVQGNLRHRLHLARPEDIQPLFFEELVDGEFPLSEDVKAVLETLSAEARQQAFEPPEDRMLHIELVESGLTCDDEGRQIALLVRRFFQRLRIFISYASEDRGHIADLASRLAGADGLKPIWDHHPNTLHPGDEWEQRLLSQVRTCDAFLFYCTQSSRDKVDSKTSEILCKEVTTALERRDCLIVPVGQPSMVPHDLRAHQWADLTLSGGYEFLVERLKQRRAELWRSVAQA